MRCFEIYFHLSSSRELRRLLNYSQCGKGRDLGFGTILNFQTKIGTGMGEQMLSREYYYLGTQLPIDRFLTFYYGVRHTPMIRVYYNVLTISPSVASWLSRQQYPRRFRRQDVYLCYGLPWNTQRQPSDLPIRLSG